MRSPLPSASLAAFTGRCRFDLRAFAGPRSRRALVALSVAAGLALAGCARQAPPPAPSDSAQQIPGPLPSAPSTPAEDTATVALLLPLSGQHAPIGSAMLDAAQLAVFDMGTDDFELVPQDTRGTPEGASAAVSAALAGDADLIIGPLLASSVTAAAPAARAAGIPILAFSNDRNVAGRGVFTLGFLPGPEVRRVASYAIGQGMVRFAAVAPGTAYGRLAVDALEEAATAGGATVTTVEFIPPEAGLPEVSEVVRRIDGAGGADGQIGSPSAPDALLLPLIGPMLSATASTLAEHDLDAFRVRYLGTGQWDQLELSSEPALVGSWYAGADPAGRAAFQQKYEETYGRAPPRLATLAYDATALAAVLSSRFGSDAFSDATLTDLEGFSGTDGLFRFRSDGTAERGLAVLEVTPSGVRVVDPAPDRFDDRIF